MGTRYDAIFVCGDTNLNLLNIEGDTNCLNFVSTMFSCSLVPVITKPTRLCGESISLIDNIFTSNLTNVNSAIIPTDLSDHCIVLCVAKSFYESVDNDFCRQVKLHSSESINNFISAIENCDFSTVINNENVSSCIECLEDLIMTRYNGCCPILTREVSYKNLIKPWIDRNTRVKLSLIHI